MQKSRLPPLPGGHLAADRWTEPFWQYCAQRQLAVPECSNCALRRMPPTPFCPRCRGQTLRWIEVSGRGDIYAFTVVRRAIMPAMDAHIPYVPAVIALREYPELRLVSAVIDSDISALRTGAPVNVVWHEDAAGQTLPFFSLTC
jgi:uncharacterized OB-fold protein